MPTYEYVCTDCGADLEAVQSFSEPSLTECPTCGGKLRKRFGAVGVVFKGSGFYRNDSRSDGRGGSGERKSDTADSASNGAKAEKSSDSGDSGKSAKTETKSEPAAKSGDSKPKSDSGSGSSSAPKASSAA